MEETIEEIKANMRKSFINKAVEIDALTKEGLAGHRKLTGDEKERKLDEYCREILLQFLYSKGGIN